MSILGLIKRTLYRAPEKVKLIAYKSLCRPLLEYACEAWDPHLSKHTDKIERVQNKATRFILNLKGICGITESKEKVSLLPLEQRRKNARIKLLHMILSNDDKFRDLIDSFDQLMACSQSSHGHSTRSVTLSTPYVFPTNSSYFHHSFLPKTSRDLRSSAAV